MADRIRYYRDLRGLTVPALVEAIHQTTGHRYQRTMITKTEGGDRRVSVHDLVAIAAGLGVAVTDLLMPPAVDPLQPVHTSASADPIPAETYWRWLHQVGAGPTGAMAESVVPVDPIAHMTHLLQRHAEEVRAVQAQLPTTTPRKGTNR